MEAETPQLLSADEVDKLNFDLARRLAARVPPDRQAAKPPSAAPKPTPEPAFVSDGIPSVGDGLSAEALARPATLADVIVGCDTVLEVDRDGYDLLKAKIARLETENARLTASLAELRAKVSELHFVSERLRIENRGPPGQKGERGRDGRDGPRGERGEKGERGERGAPAAAIIEWRPDPETFTIQAILSDGSTGPMISLRSLFESYHNAVSWVEDADLVEAARASRAATQAEVHNGWSR